MTENAKAEFGITTLAHTLWTYAHPHDVDGRWYGDVWQRIPYSGLSDMQKERWLRKARDVKESLATNGVMLKGRDS